MICAECPLALVCLGGHVATIHCETCDAVLVLSIPPVGVYRYQYVANCGQLPDVPTTKQLRCAECARTTIALEYVRLWPPEAPP